MSASPNNPLPGSAKPAPLAPRADLPAVPAFPRSDHRDLETLLALSSLHDQIRRRRAQELDKGARLSPEDSWELKQFVHDEVLQLVADRAMTVTGADGVAVALVDGSGIECRASAGKIAPERGARLDPYSGFSGACLRTGEIVRCDDSEKDKRVSAEACRRLGTRSMVAVPLATSQAIIGVLEAFSTEPLGFNDSDVRSLSLLSELILDAMKPEEEYRLAEISQRVVNPAPLTPPPVVSPEIRRETLQVEPLKIDAIRLSETETLPNAKPESQEAQALARRESDGSRPNTKLVFFSEFEPVEDSRPGLKLVILLVMLAIALGTGLWWQIQQSANRKTATHQMVKAPAIAVQPPQVPSERQDSTVSDPSLQEEEPNAGAPTQPADKSGVPAITGIRHWSSTGSSTVVIDLEDQVQYEAHRLTSPERIYFDLLDTKLAHGLFGKVIEVNDPVLQRIRIAQPKQGVTRVVLDTKGASNYSVSMEQNPYRLVVEVGRLGSKVGPSTKMDLFGPAVPTVGNATATAQAKVVAPSGASSNTTAAASVAAPLPKSVQTTQVLSPVPSFTIALDAGHGGWDLGTVGRKGLEEKDLVLDIVQRLGSLIEKRLNAKVIYTRHDDSYIALEKRAEIANLSQANLFVSIHANYSDLTSARGVETYYTNTYSSVKARPTDADNEPSLQNIDWTKVDIREKVQDSHHLAECVQQALYGTVAAKNPGIRDRGVKEAQYVVLTGTSMPAILAEVSFVSSPTDENELQSQAYRQRIAEALYKGIARYHETTRHTTMVSLLGKSN
ncbi:MAG TPA: N-acetylmuramoyl-L-alanine amidase [Terriglobales bacterium]|jgi:N-acetylmuramoyl-L-alanine amidase|nr:N-acetylmuramoyl-L-alanine amidase [Terriglobales bacterium]